MVLELNKCTRLKMFQIQYSMFLFYSFNKYAIDFTNRSNLIKPIKLNFR